MIQRIQSLFLLIAFLFGLSGFLAPPLHALPADHAVPEGLSGMLLKSWPLVRALIGISGAWALLAIFLYKNLDRQYRRVRMAWYPWAISTIIIAVDLAHFGFSGFAWPHISWVLLPYCLLRAQAGIVRDRELLKSMDRIR